MSVTKCAIAAGLMLAAVPAMEAAAQPSFDTARLERLGDALDQYVEDGRLPGAVVMITATDGETLYAHATGLADMEANRPMAQDTLFRIASQTKAITSVAILMLMEEGKLHLDQPLHAILPEWQDMTVAVPVDDGSVESVPAERPITIRHLLTHMAGVTYGDGPAGEAWADAGITHWYFADDEVPVRDTVRRMAALPLMDQPGAAFHYGFSTDILGAVIAEVSGMNLRSFFRERILEPLEMEDTHFCVPEGKAGRLAVAYGMEDDAIYRHPVAAEAETPFYGQGHYVEGPCTAYSGGAGLVSTAEDYSRFLLMLLNDGTLDGERILSRKTVELMTEGEVARDGIEGRRFGLGVMVTEDVGETGELGSVGTYGWGGAYHTTYWVDPKEGFLVTYMTQLIPTGPIDDHQKMRTLIYQALN